MGKQVLIDIQDLKKIIADCVGHSIIEALKNLEKENIPERPFLTLKETAKYLGLAEQTIYQYSSERSIPFMKKGKKLYFLKEDLDNWLKMDRYNTYQEAEIEARNFINNKSEKK
jgi:excisionase family DNA binding protein